MKVRADTRYRCICLFVVLASACSTRRPPTPIQQHAPLTASTEDLLEIVRNLAVRGREWTTRADLVYENLETGDRRSVGLRFAARKPGHIRMQGTKTLLPTIFTLISNDDGVWLDIPRKHKVYHVPAGTAVPSADGLASTLLSLAPADLLRTIVPAPPATDEVWTIREEPTRYILSSHHLDGADLVVLRDIYFERRSLKLVEVRTYDATGRLVTRTAVTSGPPDAVLPRRIRITRPYDNIRLTFDFDEAKSATLSEAVFRFRQPKGREIIDLSNSDNLESIPDPGPPEDSP